MIAKGIFNNPTLRLCVDTPKDFKLLNIIYNKFYKKRLVSIEEVLKFLINNPKIAQINLESEKQHLNKNAKEKIKQKFIKN